MIKNLTLLIILILYSGMMSAQYFLVTGKVTNASIEPIPNTNIAVEKTVFGDQTDANGNFKIRLEKGNYELVFSHIGYKTVKKNITLLADMTVNVILEEDITAIKEIELNAKKNDRSREIVRQVIQNKEKYIDVSYTCEVYIKAVQEYNDAKYKHQKDSMKYVLKKMKADSIAKAAMDAQKDTTTRHPKKNRKNKEPAQENVFEHLRINFAELLIDKSFEYPDKIKEVRKAFDKKGDVTSLFYLSTTEGEINFYQNLVRIKSISEAPFQSPLSTGGLLVYKYRMVKARVENGMKIYTIHVSPNIIGNALVTGDMEIIDSLWCIKSFHFSFPKYHLAEYDEFIMDAEFAPDSSGLWLCTRQDFKYKSKLGGEKSSGRTVAYYSKYQIRKFEKKYFNDEVSSTSQEAYDKDSAFWNTQRKEPLTKKELRFIFVSDSVKAAHSKKQYLDSIDHISNRITWVKLLFLGQENYNRKLERNLSFDPLWVVYVPISIGGPRLRYGFGYDRVFKNKTRINEYNNISYGLINHDLKGNISLARLYNPFRQGYLYLEVARNFDVINPYDSWLSILRRANFYEKDGLTIYHRFEIINGLYLRTGLEFENRHSISNYKFSHFGDSIYDNYKYRPADFVSYNSFYTRIILSYTPFQKYIREPHEKIVLGSKYPTFSVQWRKGIPHVFGGVTDFDYVEYRMEWEFKVGLAGNSRLYINSGKFYNARSLQFIDYQYQHRIGPFLFANPLYSFQSLDSSYSTLDRFYAAHYFHRFNGAILNKVPALKLLQLNESVGGGMLYSKEHNLFYFEMFAGVERSFILFSERARLGLFIVQPVSNNFKSPPQLKFTIEVYDRQENKWSY
jgi:hypothetical protein